MRSEDALRNLLRLTRTFATHTQAFSVRNRAVALQCDSRAEVDWAMRYLLPYVSQENDCAARVYVSRSDRLTGEILKLLEDAPNCAMRPFYLYRRARHFVINDIELFVPERQRFRKHKDNAETPTAEVYIREGWDFYAYIYYSDERPATPEPSRLIRDILTSELENAGDFLLHAGCVAFQGQAFAFCGAKGSGKSTLTMKALRRTGSSFVANDRLHLSIEGDGFVAWSWPTVSYFFPATLEEAGIDWRAQDFTPAYPQAKFWLETPDTWHEKKIGLLVDEIGKYVSRPICYRTPLARVFLINRRVREGTAVDVRELRNPSEIESAVAPHLFLPTDNQYPDPFRLRTTNCTNALAITSSANLNTQFLEVTGWDTTDVVLSLLPQE